ncbi:MAG: paraquat-inducible protein A [Nautiliaceae bacterium]
MYKACPYCNAVNLKNEIYCHRCGLKIKKEISLSFAFLIAGVVFYIPANLFPILQTNKFFVSYVNTIIDGIFELMDDGDYPIALIVFLASVLIPILKFLIMFYLLFSIKFKRCEFLKFKYKLYEFVSISGPWSLLDIFVVVVLSVLIRSENIFVLPREGAFYFLIMVICTMLSSKFLDIELLGEKCGN